jgi:hypothetical protein
VDQATDESSARKSRKRARKALSAEFFKQIAHATKQYAGCHRCWLPAAVWKFMPDGSDSEDEQMEDEDKWDLEERTLFKRL